MTQNSAFALLVGKVTLSRKDERDGSPHLDDAIKALELLRETMREIGKVDPEGVKGDPVVGQSVYLEFEIRVKRKEWGNLKGVVEVCFAWFSWCTLQGQVK